MMVEQDRKQYNGSACERQLQSKLGQNKALWSTHVGGATKAESALLKSALNMNYKLLFGRQRIVNYANKTNW
jgi:hypothetical protein